MTLTRNGNNKRRALLMSIAWVGYVLCIAAIFFSAAYILIYNDHEHDHDGPNGQCETCLHVYLVSRQLMEFSTAKVSTAVICGISLTILSAYAIGTAHAAFLSLVGIKVRLNN